MPMPPKPVSSSSLATVSTSAAPQDGGQSSRGGADGDGGREVKVLHRYPSAPPALTSPGDSDGSDDGSSAMVSPMHGYPAQRQTFSLGELLGLFAVSFSYAFCFNTLNTIVIPKEIERLTSSRQSMWVGLVMATGAISQLATPIVGSWSDKAGQRTPYLVYGTFIAILGIVLFLLAESFHEVLFLVVAHVTTTIGLSVQYSMVTALLNDYVSEEHTGKGSGAMAILAICGSGAGYMLFAFNTPLTYSYCAYILASVICLGICVIYIPVTPLSQSSGSHHNGAPGPLTGAAAIGGTSACQHQQGHPLLLTSPTETGCDDVSYPLPAKDHGSCSPSSNSTVAPQATTVQELITTAVVSAMDFEQHATGKPSASSNNRSSSSSRATMRRAGGYLDSLLSPLSMPSPTRFPDFFFACLGRALFNSGLAGQVYLVYYLRDIIGASNPVQITSVVAVMALAGGIVGALPSGMISDRVGKKPVIYGSIAICVTTLLAFMVVRDIATLHIVGFMYGVGNVAYLSVDYALGVQALPKKRGVPIDPAKDLGVFAMSATVGQLFGQVIYGAVLDQYGSMTATGTQYSLGGFIMIYAMGGLCFVLSGISTSYVRGVR